jgi:hypothetical protein
MRSSGYLTNPTAREALVEAECLSHLYVSTRAKTSIHDWKEVCALVAQLLCESERQNADLGAELPHATASLGTKTGFLCESSTHASASLA